MDIHGRRTGGRKKGSLNKTTQTQKQIITDLLSSYANSGEMSKDFQALEPRERLTIAERLMQYTMPKMQATAVDFNASAEVMSLEERLARLAQNPTDAEVPAGQ